MPKILEYANFCENLKEVSSLKLISKRKFHPKGLFSEQIFGPLKNYTCQCDIYHGVSKSGGKCDKCGVDIVNSDVRRKRYGKISLPIPVMNPLMYDLVCDIGGKSLKSAIDLLRKNEKSFMYEDKIEGYMVSTAPEDIPPKVKVWEKTEAIKLLIERMANEMVKEGIEEWKVIQNNLDSIIIDHVIVMPPDLRPTSKAPGNKQLMDKINRYYVQILTKKEIMKDTILDIMKDKNLYYTYFKQLQKDVDELYARVLEKMAKKEGLIRGNILGKRIDFSGRAVIVPDPTLSLYDCALPYFMILEIFKLPISKKLIEIGKFKLLNKAIDFVDECIDYEKYSLYRICEEMVKDEVCILNRQPSLHRLGMLGFNIKLTLDKVIKLHPLVCPPFNADFDGDQMAVYIPISEEAKKEIRERIAAVKNLSSPANENLTMTPSQDIILGIYFLTKKTFDEKLGIDGIVEFNSILPSDFPKVNSPVDKNVLLSILNNIKDNYPENVTVKVLDDIKRIGFKYATLYGCTMSLADCEIPAAKEMKDNIYKGQDVRKQLVELSDPSITDLMRKEFKYAYMIESGARGSWDQVKQLILSRGFISNFEGEILPLPIKSNLIEGLTPEEFFYSTYGCRKGLLDVALNTGTSGYLSRKLIFTCANLQIDENLKDCGTTDLLDIDVTNKRKAQMLVNRYMHNGKELVKITRENCLDLVGKIIKVRSPILCKSPKICTTCYGDLYKKLNSRFIGIIAAQTLGERGTQLVLRTFHTSGSAIVKGDKKQRSEMKQRDIIGDLAAASGLLHKFKNKTYTDLVAELFDVYDKDIYHVHFECVVAQLMWKNYKKWRLLPNRQLVSPDFYSVQSVPNQESWILAMAFSNPKRSILQGILHEGKYSGVMDKILKGEKIE
jgi:DNA-directed RNA polymerase subunit beta'